MIEYVNSFLLLTINIAWNYLLYLLQIQNILRAINIVTDSVTLNQLNNPGKEVDSEVKVIKIRGGCKEKTDTKTLPTINEEDTNDVIEREIE